MISTWKFQPWTHYNSKVIEIWKFNRNGCSGVKCAILNLTFSGNNYCFSHPFILKFDMGKFFGQIDNWKKIFLFFYRYQPMIEPKMAFGSLLGSSKWHYKLWSSLNTRNLIIDCIIVYSQKISNWDL